MSTGPTRPPAVADPSATGIRTAHTTVTVRAAGVPLAGQEVVVEQLGHAFRFGCTGAELFAEDGLGAGFSADDGAGTELVSEPRAAHWLDLFNTVTLPFYLGTFEPVRGRPATHQVRRMARWFVDRGCLVKGHPLAWHSVSTDWLRELPTDEVAAAQVARIRRDVGDFADLIPVWDVINEVVIMPLFDQEDNGITRLCRQVGRIPMIRMVFDAARETNPQATLLLNDFDLSAAYECLVEGVLEAGIRIDALGLQSHMHQGYWGEEKTLRILDRFSRFGLPLHLTETTLLSGELMPKEIVDLNDYQVDTWPSTPDGEARQAEEVTRHYRALLAHPAVQAVTYWGFVDGGWLGAPGGFLRSDDTPKPAFRALRSLVRGEWWLDRTPLATDDQGQIRFTGFLGEYRVTAAGRTATFSLDTSGPSRIEVDLGH
jgi:GH35 family endo-1,4-beta-xylanase